MRFDAKNHLYEFLGAPVGVVIEKSQCSPHCGYVEYRLNGEYRQASVKVMSKGIEGKRKAMQKIADFINQKSAEAARLAPHP